VKTTQTSTSVLAADTSTSETNAVVVDGKNMKLIERINYVVTYLQLRLFPPEGFNRQDAKTLAEIIAYKAWKEPKDY